MEILAISLALVVDLAVGFMVRVWSRRAFWSILACLIIPLVAAIIAAGPQALFAEIREAHYWAVTGFIWLALFGFTTCTTGVALGYLLRQRRASTLQT